MLEIILHLYELCHCQKSDNYKPVSCRFNNKRSMCHTLLDEIRKRNCLQFPCRNWKDFCVAQSIQEYWNGLIIREKRLGSFFLKIVVFGLFLNCYEIFYSCNKLRTNELVARPVEEHSFSIQVLEFHPTQKFF